MTNFKKITGISLLLLFLCHLSLKGEIAIHRIDFLGINPACPKTTYADAYWVDVDSRFKAYEWKITGGSLIDRFGQPKESIIIRQADIYQGQSEIYVTVVWNNVASKDGKKAPIGTISINGYRDDALTESNILDKGKREQEIKSLKDMRPPSLDSSVSPPILNFGKQDVRVFFIGPFNFPGIKKNGFPVQVSQYEWRIPEGWQARTGSPTSSGTYLTSTAEIRLTSDTFSGGEVRVRGVNDCAGSGDYSDYTWITFTRNVGIEFLNYPQTVPLGEVGTYEFSVLSLPGVSFGWEAPTGWSINGGGNTYTGGNVVQITTSECPTHQKVKVSIVQGDVVSMPAEFPTTVVLPAINIPTGEIRQYQPAIFSLDMPDDNISSVEWLVNGNSAGMATNTSSLPFRINESGKVKISAKLTLEGCSPVSIPEIEADVAKAPDPVISGPTTVCDEAPYTIKNFDQFPEGATVQWSVNNNNITMVSGQGTGTCVFRRNGSGKSRIQAEISLDSQVIAILSLSVSTEIKVSIVGDTNMLGCGKTRTWQYSMTCPFLDFGGPLRINWTLEGGGQRYYGSGPAFSIKTSCKRTASNDVSRQPIDTPHAFYTLRLDVTLPDGTTYSAPDEIVDIFGYIEVFGLAMDKDLRIYPNPATDMVTVELQESVETGASASRTMTTPVSGEYEIELWSMSSMLNRFVTSEPVYRLSVSGLPAGIYFVRVIRDGEIYTKKLIKR